MMEAARTDRAQVAEQRTAGPPDAEALRQMVETTALIEGWAAAEQAGYSLFHR
jgi:hypothetical protein